MTERYALEDDDVWRLELARRGHAGSAAPALTWAFTSLIMTWAKSALVLLRLASDVALHQLVVLDEKLEQMFRPAVCVTSQWS